MDFLKSATQNQFIVVIVVFIIVIIIVIICSELPTVDMRKGGKVAKGRMVRILHNVGLLVKTLTHWEESMR